MVTKPLKLDLKTESLPPSCLGPDGKFKAMNEEEHRQYPFLRYPEALIEQSPNASDWIMDCKTERSRVT